MKTRACKSGFSLLEMSVVIVIVGLLAGSAVSIMASTMQRTQYTDTKDRITDIKKALYRYYATNSRLPCPAQGTLVSGDANYGVPIYSTGGGSDTGCDTAVAANTSAVAAAHAADTPAGTKSTGGAGTWVRIGVVPTRALGLPDSMMLDAYGNKFTYIVTETFTTAAVDGIITVNDGVVPTTISAVAGFAVISHGKDGKGAWTQSGAQSTCGSSVRDAENCDGNDAIVTDAQFNDLATGASTWFDDIVGWAIKSEITSLAATSSTSCSYQFFVDTGTFTLPSGVSSYRVLAIGGGGGGGGGNSGGAAGYYGGGGGGSGYVDVASGVTFSGNSTITIGSGGAGGAGGAVIAAGSAGGATTLTNETPDITGATAGAAGAAGTTGTGGSGGVAGSGGVDNTAITPVKAASGTAQASFAITVGGTIVNDGTDTVTFTCAKFVMPSYYTGSTYTGYSNSTAYSGGSGGNGISSTLAPIYGITPAGAGGSGGDVFGFGGSNGGGGGGSARKAANTPSGGGGSAGGAGGAGGAVNFSAGGGGGGYGGAGAGGTAGTSTTYCGGGGGGYGGGTGGGYGGGTTLGGGGGAAGNGCTLGGGGGRGYGAGGGGGSGYSTANVGAGGGGGANGLVYIEWDN